MLRTLIIILVLCGGLAWFLTGQAPQRSGTLTLQPAPDFPQAATADLGRTVARLLPHCPGFARMGGEVLFTDLITAADATRITFTVPQGARIPEGWGLPEAPCVYEVRGDELRIAQEVCQALCLGKRPEQAQDVLVVNLNPPVATGTEKNTKQE